MTLVDHCAAFDTVHHSIIIEEVWAFCGHAVALVLVVAIKSSKHSQASLTIRFCSAVFQQYRSLAAGYSSSIIIIIIRMQLVIGRTTLVYAVSHILAVHGLFVCWWHATLLQWNESLDDVYESNVVLWTSVNAVLRQQYWSSLVRSAIDSLPAHFWRPQTWGLVRLFSCIISACMLYYCNTVRWAWLDWGLSGWLTTLLQCFDTVGWVIRLVKTVGRITYIVLVQTLNHAQSINWFTFDAWCISLYQICKKIKHLHHGFWCQKINFKNTGCLQLANDIQCHIKKNSCRVATSNRNALRLVKNFLLVSYNCKGILSSSLFQYCLWSRHLLYRLQSILNANAAALLVFSATRHEHISQLLHDIHWLWSLWSKVQFCLTVLNYHCLHNKQDKHNMALFGLLVWKFVKTVWTLNLYVIIYCAFCICTVNLSLMSLQTEILYFKFHCFL